MASSQAVQGHKAHLLLKIIIHLIGEVLQLMFSAAPRATQTHFASGAVQGDGAAADGALEPWQRPHLGPLAK